MDQVWLAAIGTIGTLITVFSAAIGAVWHMLSKRIGELQTKIDEQGKQLLLVSEDRARAVAEANWAKERTAEYQIRLKARDDEVVDYKHMLRDALNMRQTFEEMNNIRNKLERLTEKVEEM